MKDLEYDIVAVGGGTGGLVAGIGAAYLGARSAIVEKEALGGDCLWTGCVPSKALVASARLAHGMRHADELGLTAVSPAHSFPEVMGRMRSARARIARHDDPEHVRSKGPDVHLGSARFAGPGTLEVEGVGRIRAPRFVLATGAVPAVPRLPGLEEAGYLTHATVFDQDSLPATLLVLGCGPVGIELAQVFSRLGVKVTVLEMQGRILPGEDPDVADALRGILEREGVRIVTAARALAVERRDGRKVVRAQGDRSLEADQILVATGRRPATGDLDLDRAGVELDGAGVRVDRRLRTTAKGIWAAGDVTGGPQFTHVADYMAKLVVQNSLLPLRRNADYSSVPRVTYTDPEVAHVGLGQEEAEARGGRTYTYEFADLDRAVVDAETLGFVKVSADRRGRILGGTVLGSRAGELVLPLVLAMRHGIPLGKISASVFPYPTMTEGLKRAADAYSRSRLEGPAGRMLRRIVRWLA